MSIGVAAKRTIAGVAGVGATAAGAVLSMVAARLTSVFHRPGMPRVETTVGFAVILAMAALSYFEAYRFLNFCIRRKNRTEDSAAAEQV